MTRKLLTGNGAALCSSRTGYQNQRLLWALWTVLNLALAANDKRRCQQ